MRQITLKQETFIGGISEGSKSGFKGGFQFGEGVDFRTDRDALGAHYRLTKESGSVVVDLIKWLVEYEGTVFAYGDAGNLYKRTTATWVKKTSAISGGAGQGLAIFNTLNSEALWYAQSTKLGRAIGLTSDINSMTFDDNYIKTIGQDIDQNLSPGTYGQVYTLTSAIDEGATHRQTFIPTKENLLGFDITVSSVGTGNWTLTLHDSNNVSVAAVTVAFSALSGSGAFNRFTFASPVLLIPGASYHIHITSSNTTGTVTSGTASDLEDCGFKSVYPPLNADTNYHPMKELGNLLLIGNGNYLATLEDTEIYNPERLKFPRGEKVRAIEVIGGYAHISTWRGDDISKYGMSRKYIWDGVSPLFNDYIPYSGQINAMQNSGDNMLYDIHNIDGSISVYTGAVTKKRQIKNLSKGKSIEVYPGAVTIWNNILYFGTSAGTSTDEIRGVWSYGRKDNDMPNAMGFDYKISTGNKGSTVQIGSLIGINQTTFLVAWKDGSSYGVDCIDTTTQQSKVYFKTLRLDGGTVNRKEAMHINLLTSPLTLDDTITIYYRLDNRDNKTDPDLDGFTFLKEISGRQYKGKVAFTIDFIQKFHDIELMIELSGAITLPTLYRYSIACNINDETRIDNY